MADTVRGTSPALARILQQAMTLSAQERKELAGLLVDSLEREESPREAHSLSELRGLGKEIWEGVDVKSYIDELRNDWD